MANESRPCPCGVGDRFDYEGCGQEVQVEHIKAYVCKAPASTDKAVVVIHDIFGWQLPNTRYMADMLAANGYMAPSHSTPERWAGQAAGWQPRSTEAGPREADAVLKYLKEQCGAKKLGVVGFCWGGIAVHHLMMTYPELKAGVSLYGLIKDSDDISNLLNPTFFIFAEKDDFIPLHQVTLLEQKLKKNCKVDFEVKIYPGQTHGFVHRRGEDTSPQDKPYIEEGRTDMINWLNKYI
ncbi:Carboxymethylenebutenolidase [Pygoscelis adeliae]|uniref:Carboxymethylenebutenolidase homolog n=1 Tax=Pygoscelis adeliae TaxID=9238 RepID=A0A093P0L7_PYGAD|nr:Carboxymethylenebutenolidase [Pygoscelis adeliae]